MGRTLGILIVGAAAGALLVMLAQRLDARHKDESVESLADKIADRLETLERDARTA